MEYRRLGKAGLRLSALSFGSWVTFHNQVREKEAEQMLGTAYEAGVNFFDNAEVYAEGQSEEIMGKAIRNLGWSRDSFCVSSKVYWGGKLPTQRGLHRKHVVEACHAALKRLQVDHLDLYFCHRPDALTPVEETVRTMGSLVQQGKVLYWGTSEWSAQQIQEAYGIARELGLDPPMMEQPQYNLFARPRVEVEYARLYQDMGLGLTIWSPLASGILTGKYSSGIPSGSRVTLPGFEWLREKFESEEGKDKIAKSRQLNDLAKDIGCSLPQLAIAWCLKNPHVSSVILGASRVEQLQETLKATSVVGRLTEEVMGKIEAIVANRPEPDPIF